MEEQSDSDTEFAKFPIESAHWLRMREQILALDSKFVGTRANNLASAVRYALVRYNDYNPAADFVSKDNAGYFTAEQNAGALIQKLIAHAAPANEWAKQFSHYDPLINAAYGFLSVPVDRDPHEYFCDISDAITLISQAKIAKDRIARGRRPKIARVSRAMIIARVGFLFRWLNFGQNKAGLLWEQTREPISITSQLCAELVKITGESIPVNELANGLIEFRTALRKRGNEPKMNDAFWELQA